MIKIIRSIVILICIFSLPVPIQTAIAMGECGDLYCPYYRSDLCPSDKPFTYAENKLKNIEEKEEDIKSSLISTYCFGCNHPKGMRVARPKDFEICSEREIVNGFSRLKHCPKHFFHNSLGDCVSCDETKFISVFQETDCTICPNRTIVSLEKYGLHCQLQTCPPEAPLSVGGDCLPCDAYVAPPNPKEACNICPNRLFRPKGHIIFENDLKKVLVNKDICVPQEKHYNQSFPDLFEEINTEKKKWDGFGFLEIEERYCDDCNLDDKYRLKYKYDGGVCGFDREYYTLPELCSKCPNREFIEGICVRTKCPDNMVEDVFHECHSCDDVFSARTTAENCRVCPDTHFTQNNDNGEGICYHSQLTLHSGDIIGIKEKK